MKTILYLIPHLQKSSPVIQLFGMIKYLDRDKYNPIILSFFKERQNSIQEQFVEQGVSVISANLERWQLLQQKKLLKDKILEIQPDIIHSCSVLTDGICSDVDIHVPLVLTVHSFIYEDVLNRYGKLLGWYMCKREEKTMLKADAVITCSKTLAEKYQKKILRDYIPIQNGIETSLWEQDESLKKEILRDKLDLPREAFIVLSTNLLDSIKDPILLIKAFKEADLQNAILIMLGDGNIAGEAMKYASETVKFTGRVDNVKEYLYAADVLVSASKSEGLPYAILEAECTGINMILSDIPQHLEVAGDNIGVKFFPVGDKGKLSQLLKESNFKITTRTSYDLRNFTARVMSEKYQNVYMSFWV